MKVFTQVRKYGAKAAAGGVALALVASAHADPITDIFAAVDLSTVATAVGVIGLAVMGIVMAFKAIDLGKRGVKKV